MAVGAKEPKVLTQIVRRVTIQVIDVQDQRPPQPALTIAAERTGFGHTDVSKSAPQQFGFGARLRILASHEDLVGG